MSIIYATTIYGEVGALTQDIVLISSGMIFALIGLIIGITRGSTKNNALWTLTFTALAWTIALIMPSIIGGSVIFLLGAISLTFVFTPLVKEQGNTNILSLAIILFVFNFMIVLGTSANNTVGEYTSLQEVNNDLRDSFQSLAVLFGDLGIDPEVCNPNEEDCSSPLFNTVLEKVFQDPITTILSVGEIIGKVGKLIEMITLAPLRLQQLMGEIGNKAVILLMQIYILLFEFVIIYQLAKFVLNKRGMD